MKKSLLTFMLIFAFAALTFGSQKAIQNQLREKPNAQTEAVQIYSPSETQSGGDFEGGIIWKETFEGAASWRRWMTKDNTYPRPEVGPSEWIVNDWEAYDGTAWRCANLAFGDNGGYDNHWYQVLDTPPITLDENATFSFYHRYAAESPGGASAPYDAWDGMNVRISTDGGETFTVLPFATYNVSSIWAFGHPTQGQNEGPGIAGWAGENDIWTLESIDLSAYTSSDTPVILRFAFASDMAYSTADGAPALYGWQIDNIEVKSASKTIFSNYGTDVDMTGKSNEFIPPVGEDLWHLVKIEEPLPALTPEFKPYGFGFNHAASCQHGSMIFDPEATYNPYMDNIIYTGPISIPNTSPVYLDYKYFPDFYDADPFPDVEYFRPEVSLDGETWEFIEADPYVYSLGFDQWIEFAWTYGYPTNMSMFDLSRFAGQDIYLSFRFWSDYDTPIGRGLLLDDIVIYSPTRFVPAPTNVTAEANAEDRTILISWDPQHPYSTQTIWRQKEGEKSYAYLAEVSGVNQYIDASASTYYTYNYVVTTTVKYNGRSEPSNVATAQIIPAGVVELSYDDAESDSSIVAENHYLIAVKFTPDTYPASFEAVKIFLDKANTTGSAGQFAIYDDDGANGTPGTRFVRKSMSGLTDGFNILVFNSPVTITEGSCFITYKRYNGPIVGVDLDAPIDNRTYVQTASGWVQQTGYDAIMHAFVNMSTTQSVDVVSGIDLSNELKNPDAFTLLKNYPNPFNPSTTINYNVPSSAAGQDMALDIFNVLGEKIASLYSGTAHTGLNSIKWNGKNNAGISANTGIYIVRLQAGNTVLSQRILLMK